MSIIYESENCTFIDHCQYISKLYENVLSSDKTVESYALSPNIFSIKCDSNKITRRKRKSDANEISRETAMVKEMFIRFAQEVPSQIKLDILHKYNVMETSHLRDLVTKYFESTAVDLTGISGGNDSDLALKCKIKENYFLIPPKSRFLCGCVTEQCLKLSGNKYDILVADPPWWNKYIRRLKGANDKLSYPMMYNEDIASIPVKQLLAEHCVVAVWATNAPSVTTAVKELIFPRWGVEYVTTWYWLKLSVEFQPMSAFAAGCAKQPYERLIIGKAGDVQDIPAARLLASVPSALHSHKPPLLDVLRPLARRPARALELFARSLLPRAAAVGREPLRWQHVALYRSSGLPDQ